MSELSDSRPAGLQEHVRLPFQSPQRVIEALVDQVMNSIDRGEIRIADFSHISADQSEIVVLVAPRKPEEPLS